jgi:hypothetical protein
MRKFLTSLSGRPSACDPAAAHLIISGDLDAEAQAIRLLSKYSPVNPDGIGDPKS